MQLTTVAKAARGAQPGTGVLPFTAEIQTALLAALRAVLPPLSNNLGSRWVCSPAPRCTAPSPPFILSDHTHVSLRAPRRRRR